MDGARPHLEAPSGIGEARRTAGRSRFVLTRIARSRSYNIGDMGSADLHIHTDAGDGLDSAQRILDHVETQTDLDVIAITEHDSLEVALRAHEAWARGSYRFDFIPGVEVTTLEGHLIALYLERPIASLRRVEETIDAVHAQGGVCF